MTESVDKLIAALREELKHYGEMLALLDQQQESAINRLAEEMFAATTSLQRQATLVQNVRRERTLCQRGVARELCVTETSTFVELIPLVPADFQPLLQSLVDENNASLRRVHERAHQNHLVLSRSVEMMQGFLGMLFPAREMQVYNGHGSRELHALPAPPLYEALG